MITYFGPGYQLYQGDWVLRGKFFMTRSYLEGQGDAVSRSIMRISRVTTWLMGVINLLTKCP